MMTEDLTDEGFQDLGLDGPIEARTATDMMGPTAITDGHDGRDGRTDGQDGRTGRTKRDKKYQG